MRHGHGRTETATGLVAGPYLKTWTLFQFKSLFLMEDLQSFYFNQNEHDHEPR